MTTVKRIREFDQAMFLQGGGPVGKRGVCYFACEYMADHIESRWNNCTNFAAAKEAVAHMPLAAMMNYAKAKETRWAPQDEGYNDPLPLAENYLYRVEFEVLAAPKSLFHEVAVLTSVGELMLFDVKFGIFHIDGVASGGHQKAVEDELTRLHSGKGKAVKFGYKKARKAFS